MKNMICYFIVFLLIGCSGQLHSEANLSNPLNKANNNQVHSARQKTEIADTRSDTVPNKESDIVKDLKNKTIYQSQEKKILDVPIIKQNPELKYGCEVTSLAMVLQYAGIQVGKMELADQLPKDNDPISQNNSGDITDWGNPDHGFVGDITGKHKGYAVYVKPVEKLMDQYLPGRTLNLTGKSFDDLLIQIKKGKPVEVWTTGDFTPPDRWESWNHGSEKIRATFDLHAVVLVGFDTESVYVNDPLTGNKAQKVNKQSFIDSWNALGKQALSYR